MNRPENRPSATLAAAFSVAACGLLASCSASPPAGQTPPPADSSSAAPTASASSSAASSSSAAPGASGTSSAKPDASAAAKASSFPPVTLVLVEPVKAAGPPPRLGVVAPAKNQVIPAAKAPMFDVRVSARDWKPGAGDHLCVVLDKGSCKRVTDASKPVALGELGGLEPGQHVISVLARHATGEFFRPAGKSVPFASVSFFVEKKVPLVHKDGAPMLIYSPPEAGPAPPEGVLIDYFVANGEVQEGKLIVTASIGGPGIESGTGLSIKENKPLRLQNARPGEYVSRLTLMQYVPAEIAPVGAKVSVTYTAKALETPFGEAMRSFFVLK